MSNGKLTDVIIEEFFVPDPKTGVDKFSSLTVWHDQGAREIIKSIPGVLNVYKTHSEFESSVYIDPRYDKEWIKAEIEAQLKIRLSGE